MKNLKKTMAVISVNFKEAMDEMCAFALEIDITDKAMESLEDTANDTSREVNCVISDNFGVTNRMLKGKER